MIEVVRGRLGRTQADDLLSFWFDQRALSGEEAKRRQDEVVCMLRHRGALAGTSSVYAADVALIGARRFWIYRSLLDRTVADMAPAMIRATFSALEEQFDGAPGSPIGLCALIADPEERRRRPQAEWSDPQMIYAGYLNDGRQVRIAYFKDASKVPAGQDSGTPPGYRIELFAEQEHVSAQDVIDLWTRESALQPAEAERRVTQIVFVATDQQGRPVGVATSYLHQNEQLRSDLWYTRVFIAKAHRQSGLSGELGRRVRDHFIERFTTGVDRRGIGLLYEVESEILKRSMGGGISPQTKFAFIGENAGGAHIRVFYFPGALAPEPQGSA